MVKREKRGFTVHGRKYWWTKNQLAEELGVPKSDVATIWADGERKSVEKKILAKKKKR